MRQATLTLVTALAVLLVAAAPAAWADFGPLGVGPRALGKGGAFSAEAEGPWAPYWNPAGARSAGGFRVRLSYGLLQRPDFDNREYGNTSRSFLGASWAPLDEKDKPGLFGIALAVETPFPQFKYKLQGNFTDETSGNTRLLGLSLRQNYMEVLAAGSIRAFAMEMLGGELALSAGLSIGMGMTEGHVEGFVQPVGGGTQVNSDDHPFSGSSLSLPGALGILVAFESKAVDLSLGVRYRGVMGLGESDVLTFGSEDVTLKEPDVFMPPPQEGSVGLCATFFDRLVYSVELTYFFFDAPDAFPNVVPHNYPVFKFGFEFRAPSEDETRELALRFGFSMAFIDTDAQASIYTSETTGIHMGLGVQVHKLARVDFYFAYLIPGEGDVDEETFVASVSYGLEF